MFYVVCFRLATAPPHQPTPPNAAAANSHAFPLNEQERQVLQFNQQHAQLRAATLQRGGHQHHQAAPQSQPHHVRQAAHIQHQTPPHATGPGGQQQQQAPHSVHGAPMGTPQRAATNGGMTPAPPGSAPNAPNGTPGGPPKKKMTKAEKREKVRK